METLIDIRCYWNSPIVCIEKEDFKFTDEHMWQGQILLKKSGWFEGIINYSNNYSEDIMIFGVYRPFEKIAFVEIRLFKFTDEYLHWAHYGVANINLENISVNDGIAPKGYSGRMDNGIDLGLTHIITRDVERLKLSNDFSVMMRNVEKEKEELMKRLEIFKSKRSCEQIKELEKNFFELLVSAEDLFFGNFYFEDIDFILRDWQSTTIEQSKQYKKEYSNDNLSKSKNA